MNRDGVVELLELLEVQVGSAPDNAFDVGLELGEQLQLVVLGLLQLLTMFLQVSKVGHHNFGAFDPLEQVDDVDGLGLDVDRVVAGPVQLLLQLLLFLHQFVDFPVSVQLQVQVDFLTEDFSIRLLLNSHSLFGHRLWLFAFGRTHFSI